MEDKLLKDGKFVTEDLNSHLEQLIAQKKIRSAAYCIAKNGRMIACHAMGDMDLGNGEKKKISTDTIFEIQSITKWITAAAILILQERGELSICTNLRKT